MRFPRAVSMRAFKKEEDYWDRLERLEAKAEAKPSRMALLLGGRSSRNSLKPRQKMNQPKIRTLQQPLLSRSKRKPDRRPSVVGSPAAVPRPGDGSALGKKSPRQAGQQGFTAPMSSVQRMQPRVQRHQETAVASSATVERKESSGTVSDLLSQILNPGDSGGNNGNGVTAPGYTGTSAGSRPKPSRQGISPVARIVSGREQPGRRPVEGHETGGKDRLGVKKRAKMAESARASGNDGSVSGAVFKRGLKRMKVSVSSEVGERGAGPSGNVSATPGARTIPRQRSRLPGNDGGVGETCTLSIGKQGGSRVGDPESSGKHEYRALLMTSSVGSSVIVASSHGPDRRQTRPLVFGEGPGPRLRAEVRFVLEIAPKTEKSHRIINLVNSHDIDEGGNCHLPLSMNIY